jgi:hypothetical protein
MIRQNNGNALFVEKAKIGFIETAQYLYLDDTNCRSKTAATSPSSYSDSVLDLIFYSYFAKKYSKTLYDEIFKTYTIEKEFILFIDSTTIIPTINDIAVYKEKGYWINEISYPTGYKYKIKAYGEVDMT